MADLNLSPSPSRVTRPGSSLRRPNGNSPVSAAGSGPGGCPTVILMEYWISRGQGSCLYSKFSISFMSRQTGDIWQPGEGRGDAWLDAASHQLSLLSAAVTQSPCPFLPLVYSSQTGTGRACGETQPSLSPANYSVCHKFFTCRQAYFSISI